MNRLTLMLINLLLLCSLVSNIFLWAKVNWLTKKLKDKGLL
ncbi:hypothetical protein FNU3_111 [Fusobacterium phage vB_FnuS_FNU3]|nr:hypothetical protein FNU2_18 [Fusobacterium phage vB_FnuS_FNU2]WGH50459.1 hypothetical protein FNU3_111 [Fusobacterium phage vB_FnuS_FNU3]